MKSTFRRIISIGISLSISIAIVLVIVSLACMLTSCEMEESFYFTEPTTKEMAREYLDQFGIKVIEREKVKGEVPVATADNQGENKIIYELPDISNYSLSVKGDGEIDVEVFLPIENNGSSILELVSHVAESFNKQKIEVDSKKASVSVRALEASLAEEYILNGTYLPKGYIAVNELYGALMQENGINVSLISNRTVGNTMGIVIEKSKYKELSSKYGEVTIQTIVKASEAGDISIGYTNPTNNPTGLNFVISMLSYFDASNPMSFEATTDFSKFQSTVSKVSFSTDQMKKAVEEGVLDAFVMENQAFVKDETLSNEFEFMPFGTRHDNPLYAVGEVSETEVEVLKQFAEFFNTSEIVEYSRVLGFMRNETYTSTVENCEGAFITTVLDLWKTEKNRSNSIEVIFVADTSGSMSGEKLKSLKTSLLNAMQFIGEDTKVGLMSFSSSVYSDLSIAKFDTEQREYFAGAVNKWRADGGTATNDALIAAFSVLLNEMDADPNVKPLVIVLSDGCTQSGYRWKNVEPTLDKLDIPIYTIGYGKDANEKELKQIADINGGTFIKADNDDISYIIKTLFNAET